MIVRNAILSDEPYTLAATSLLATASHDVLRPVPARRFEVSPLPIAAVPSEALPLVKHVAPVLTAAIVAAWLAEQNRDVLGSAVPGLAAELAEMREDGYAAGFDAGQIEGRAAALQQTTQLHGLLRTFVDAIRAEYEQEQARLAAMCVEIVATAIGKIAGPLLATREAAHGAVAEALAKAKGGYELTVRVSPSELPLLEPQREQLAALTSMPALLLVADSQVTLGGCMIDSQAGTLDARLEVQLQGLYDTLRAAKQQGQMP